MKTETLTMTRSELGVLESATRGNIVPEKTDLDEFKSLVAKGLLKHKGGNRYKITKTGLYVVTQGAETKGSTKEVPSDHIGNGHSKSMKSASKAKNGSNGNGNGHDRTGELDAEYHKKYDWYVKGSIARVDPASHKRTALIQCTMKGCKQQRKVFTPDLFQVKLCENHRDEAKANKLKKLRASK